MTERTSAISTTSDALWLRDAAAVAERIAADEASAAAARDEYRAHGLPKLPTHGVPLELVTDEQIHAYREAALFEGPSPAGSQTEPSWGPLWVTSERLVHGGTSETSVPLAAVAEMTIAVGRLLLVGLHDGSGVAIETDQPRLLRVQIAAAIEASRLG